MQIILQDQMDVHLHGFHFEELISVLVHQKALVFYQINKQVVRFSKSDPSLQGLDLDWIETSENQLFSLHMLT